MKSTGTRYRLNDINALLPNVSIDPTSTNVPYFYAGTDMLRGISATGWHALLPAEREAGFPDTIIDIDMRKAFARQLATSSYDVTQDAHQPAIDLTMTDRSDSDTRSQTDACRDEESSEVPSRDHSQDGSLDNYTSPDVEKAYTIIEFSLFGKVPVTQTSPTYNEDLDPCRMKSAKGSNTLLNYQKDAVARLGELESRFRGGICADDMGLGKTVVSIACSETWPLNAPELIVAPRSVMKNWENEFNAWLSPAPRILFYDENAQHISVTKLKDYDKVIVSYDRVRMQYTALCQWMLDCPYRRRHPKEDYRVVHKGQRVVKQSLVKMKFRRPNISLLLMFWGRIIFDEVHVIKNPKTSVAQACCLLKAQTRLLLTGTPFGNDYSDIQSLFRLLKLEPFDQKGFFDSHFKNKVKGRKKTSTGDLRIRSHENPRLETERNAFLAFALDAVTIRRHKLGTFDGKPILKDIPIPDIQQIDLLLDDGTKYDHVFQYACKPKSNGQQARAVIAFREFLDDPESVNMAILMDNSIKSHNFVPHNEIECQFLTRFQWCNSLREWAEDKHLIPKNENLLADMTLAVMSACHWALPGARYGDVEAKSALESATESSDMSQVKGNLLTKYSKNTRLKFQDFIKAQEDAWRSTKMECCVSIVKERQSKEPGDGILVFSSFLSALDVLEIGLLKNDIRALRLDGTVSPQKRYEAITEFQSSKDGACKVMLLTSRCGGEGLTLHKATTVIILNPEWTPAREEQSWGRAVRIGQLKTVTVYLIRALNSMDDRCIEKQVLKTSKKTGLLDLVMANDDGDIALNVSASDEVFRKRTLDAIAKLQTFDKGKIIEMFRGIYVEGKNVESSGSGHRLPTAEGVTNVSWLRAKEGFIDDSDRPITISSDDGADDVSAPIITFPF